MYVAITRAKHHLYISRAHERYTFGNYSANPKSRFVKEIPEEFIELDTSRASSQSIFGGGGGGGFSSLGNMFGAAASSTTTSTYKAGNPSASKKKNTASDFQVGNQIKHPQYGIGTIVAKNEAIADIAFPGLGIKKMNIEIAPIERMG